MTTVESICDYFEDNYTYGEHGELVKFEPSKKEDSIIISIFDGNIDDWYKVGEYSWKEGCFLDKFGNIIIGVNEWLYNIINEDEWLTDEEYEKYCSGDFPENVPERYIVDMILRETVSCLKETAEAYNTYAEAINGIKEKGHVERTNTWRIQHMNSNELAEFLMGVAQYGNRRRKQKGWKKWLGEKSKVELHDLAKSQIAAGD